MRGMNPEAIKKEAHDEDIQILFEGQNRNATLIEMLYEKLGIEIPEDPEEYLE